MKRLIYLSFMGCLAAFIAIFTVAPQAASAASSVSYTLYIDGKVSSTKSQAVVENGVALIPLKPVLTELKYSVTVDNKTKAIKAKNSAGSYITVKAGSKKAVINGSNVTLPASIKAIKGTTYMPLSAIKQLTGKSIGVDNPQLIAWIGEKPVIDVAPWGATPDEIKSISSQMLLIDEGSRGEAYYLIYQNTDRSQEAYFFYNNKLAKVAIIPDISEYYNEEELISFYSGIVSGVSKSYGAPVSDVMGTDKDSIEEISIINGDYLQSQWKIGRSEIVVLLKATNKGYMVSMSFINTEVEAQLDAALNALQ